MTKHGRNMMWSLAWVWLVGLFCNMAQAAEPDWLNQVVNYPNYTGVLARVYMDGVPLHADGSLLAAFYGDETTPRGAARILGANPDDDIDGEYYFSLLFGSNQTGETGFKFKLWDSATDAIYDLDKTLDFDTNYPAKPETYGGFTTAGFAPCIMKVGDFDYTIKVTGGTSSKAKAKAGEIITITANSPSSTQALKTWSATDGVEFVGSILAATTTFIMPAKDVTLTASFIAKSSMPAVSVKSTVAAGAAVGDDTAKEPASATSAADKGKFTFTRTLPTGMTGALTVYFDIRGTATNGVDYKSIPGSVSFASGASSVELNIEPLFDGDEEGDETVEVVLKPATGTQTYRGGTYTDATVTIEDIMPLPVYSITVVNGTSNKASAVEGEIVEITADAPPAGMKFDKWTSNDLTITSATSSTATFTMPAKNVTVTANYVENIIDPDQEYKITVNNGTASKAKAKAGEIITITANPPSSTQALKIWSATDGVEFIGSVLGATTTFTMPAKDVTLTASFIAKSSMPAVSVKSTAAAGDDTAEEPESATAAATDKGKFTFTRTLPTGMTGALTVYFDVRGTAANGVDYKSIPGSVSFASGASSVELNIEPLFDGVTEADETVEVVLKPASGTQTYRGGTYTDATVTIKSIDPDPDPSYTITVNGGTASKTKAKAGEIITITANPPASTQALKIWSATDGVEFIGSVLGATTTFRMPAKNVTLTANFIAKTQMPAIAVRSTTNAGDDTAKEPASATAAATDKGKFTFTRTLPTGMTGALTVYFDIRGTATNGTDYKSIPGSVSFASGVSSVTLDVEPLFDSLVEGDETVEVVLKPASGTQTYRGGAVTDATVTIQDVPPQKPTLTIVLSPDAVVTAGAQWQVNGTWYNSGDTATLDPGTYTVAFKDVNVAGYATPEAQTITLNAGNQITKTVAYPREGPDDYHPADTDNNYIVSGLEYLNYVGPVKAAALGNYEYDWDGVDVLSFARKATRGGSRTRGANDVAITRELSPSTYSAGGTVEVTLVVSGADKMLNLFIGEIIPEGWTVVGNAASYVVDGVLRMTWDKPDIPRTFTYAMQAPATNLAASYVIASSAEDTGCYTDGMVFIEVADSELLNNYNYHPADCITKDNRISGLEYLKYAGPVKAVALGNDEYEWDGVDVMSIRKKGATRGGSAADDVALARSVDMNTYEAGSQVTVTLSISGADSMVSLFIGEKIPEGWTVLGNLADNVRNGVLRMTWDAPNIPDTVTYTLQAPAEGLAASCRIASSTVDTGCFTDRVVFLKAEDTVLTWDTDQKPAEWPQDMKLYTPADGKNFRESDKLAVTFSWPAILNADSYRLVIATCDGAVVFDETVKETVCTVSGLACGTFIWNVTANGDGCIAGTVWQDFAFSVVPDTPAPVIAGAAADGTAVRLAFDKTEAGYADGVFAYQMVFFSLKTCSWTSLTRDLQVVNGRAVVDLGVEAADGYLYISPVTTPESDFVELYIK